MRNRNARAWFAVVTFSLVFPVLIVLASPKGFADTSAIMPLFGAEAILLAGIAVAAKERRHFEGETTPAISTFKLGSATPRSHVKLSASARVSAR